MFKQVVENPKQLPQIFRTSGMTLNFATRLSQNPNRRQNATNQGFQTTRVQNSQWSNSPSLNPPKHNRSSETLITTRFVLAARPNDFKKNSHSGENTLIEVEHTEAGNQKVGKSQGVNDWGRRQERRTHTQSEVMRQRSILKNEFGRRERTGETSY